MSARVVATLTTLLLLAATPLRADEPVFPDFPAGAAPDAYRYTLQADVTGLQKGKPFVRKDKLKGEGFARLFARRAAGDKAEGPPRVAVLFLTAPYCDACQPKESFDPVGEACTDRAKVLHLIDDEIDNEGSGAKVAYEPGKRPPHAASLFVFSGEEARVRFAEAREKLLSLKLAGPADTALPSMIVVVDGKVVARIGGCRAPAETQAAIENAVRASKLPGTDQWKCR